MLNISISVLPIFILLLLGVVFSKHSFPFDGFWAGVDKLVYWVLFPALLFNKTSQINFSDPLFEDYAIILLSALFFVTIVSIVWSWSQKMPPPTSSSFLQACIRFNTFVVLAVAEAVYGDVGLLYAALGASILIPSINIMLVLYMVFAHGKKDVRITQLIIKEIVKNPLIIGIYLGVSTNLLGFERIFIVSQMAEILSQATLPLVLLAVGAGLKFNELKEGWRYAVSSSVFRFILFPVCIAILCSLFKVEGIPAVVAICFGAVPTATSGYALAKQMGGNAPLIAALISTQTAISLLILPLTIWFAQSYF